MNITLTLIPLMTNGIYLDDSDDSYDSYEYVEYEYVYE